MMNMRARWTGICFKNTVGGHSPDRKRCTMKKYERVNVEILIIADVIATSGPGEEYEGEIDWSH